MHYHIDIPYLIIKNFCVDTKQHSNANVHFLNYSICPRYDVVTIEKNNDTVKQLQEDLGIWQPSMASVG